MAAVMQTNDVAPRARYNMYVVIHKALRVFMSDTLHRWGRMDPADECERAQALEHVRALLGMCTGHLQNENEFVHPAIERVRPGFTQQIAHDHADHETAIAQLDAALAQFEHAAPTLRDDLSYRIYLRLSAFIAENLEHMIAEETENQCALAQAYTDEQLLAIEHAIVSSMPPEKSLQGLRLMLPNINASERAFMLAGMKQNTPPEACQQAMQIAREVLSERDYYKLERAVY